jgi:galactokinase
METAAQLAQEFAAEYGRPPAVLARAPGRLEILGNHTDYNQGFTLSCAVDRATFFAAAPATGSRCRLLDTRDGLRLTFDVTQIGTPVPGLWANYVLGVVVELQRRGHQVRAFDAALRSELPLASGMSSSAALEISAALALGRLNGIELPPAEWARVGQASENLYVGAKTGLLDQLSSLLGRQNSLVHIDFRSLAATVSPVPAGVSIVVANSGVKHNLTQDYNERRRRCEEAAAALGAPFLRDVTLAQLRAAKAKLDVMAYRRALHVVGENDRVGRALAALAAGDLPAFGALWVESHTSSRENFENSCPELDALVASGSALPGFYGARLSGGGFGGISIHLVRAADAAAYRERLGAAFAARFGRVPDTMISGIGPGAGIHV